MFRRALLGVLSVTAAGTLTLALAGPAMAAPPAVRNCSAPGLIIAAGNAQSQVQQAQAALTAAEVHLAAVLADPASTDADKAAAQQAVTDAETALTAAKDHAIHLGLVSIQVAGNRCHINL